MKKEEKREENVLIETPARTLVKATLVGTSDLILNKKARSFSLPEIWKQSHDKGEKMPARFSQSYNLWEKLITSIDWLEPIEFHDDDWSLYTEEEWLNYMNNNAPCLNAQAIFGSMAEAFVSFGFKSSTGKNGTDIKRGVSLSKNRYPITFTEASYVQELVPTSRNKVNVLGQHNVFTGWKCEIELYTAEVAFPAKTIVDLLSVAGQFIGLSTQRKNGYGRFTLDDVSLIELKD